MVRLSRIISALTAPASRRAQLRLALMLALLTAACIIDTARAGSATAPDFALRSLEQGNQRLSEFRGQVVVLTFWASWCGECRRGLPELNAFYEDHRDDGLVMFGINLDQDAARARDFRRTLGLAFPVLMDPHGAVSRLYDVSEMPRTVVIDRDGVVRHVFDDLDERESRVFRARVTSLLTDGAIFQGEK